MNHSEKYNYPDALISELLFVINYAESDLNVLAKGDNSDRTKETLREITRVKEMVAQNKIIKESFDTHYPYDLFK